LCFFIRKEKYEQAYKDYLQFDATIQKDALEKFEVVHMNDNFFEVRLMF